MIVSIRQVAEAAGVSVATVSHVLNGKGNMKAETRQRVQQMIREMGYLRKRPAGCDLAFFTTVPHGFGHTWMRQAAAEHGFTVHIEAADDRLAEPPEFDVGKRMAGVVLFGGQWRHSFLEPIMEEYPTVLLGSYLPTMRGDGVWVDNAGGMYLAVHYLVRQGHRRIGLINGTEKSATSSEKQTGFERALRHADLSDGGVVVGTPDFSVASGREAAYRLLAATPRPTAIVAGETAFGLATLRVCRDLGLDVPADLSLITFNDSPRLERCVPLVTAISIPELAICREAVSLLVRRIDNPSAASQRILLQPELITRRSVCPPRLPGTSPVN